MDAAVNHQRPTLPQLKDEQKINILSKVDTVITNVKERVRLHAINYPVRLKAKAEQYATEIRTDVSKLEKWKVQLTFKPWKESAKKGFEFFSQPVNKTMLAGLKTTEVAFEDIIGTEGVLEKAADYWKTEEATRNSFRMERSGTWRPLQLRVKAICWEERVAELLNGNNLSAKHVATNIQTIETMYKGVTQTVVQASCSFFFGHLIVTRERSCGRFVASDPLTTHSSNPGSRILSPEPRVRRMSFQRCGTTNLTQVLSS